jgi:tetratricopeptide (TPR) repeat protein
VFDLLTQLVDKSLVQVEKREGEERYRLLETIRQYARDRLVDVGESEAVRNRHFDWFLELAERVEPELIGPRQVAWLDRLEIEQDNFRAALAWGLDSRPAIEGLRLAGALWRLWHVRDLQSEGLAWLRRVLAAPGAQEETAARAKVLHGVVELTLFVEGSSSEEKLKAAEESLAICQSIGDRAGAAWSMNMVGRLASEEADYARAESLFDQALAMARREKARWVIAQVLEGMGELAATRGSLLSARQNFEESLALFRDLGDRRAISGSCFHAGLDAGLLGDYLAAHERFAEALSISRELGARAWCGYLLLQVAALASIGGHFEQSHKFIDESLTIARDTGSRWLSGWGLACAGWLGRAEGDNAQATTLTMAALRLCHTAVVPGCVRLCLNNVGVLAIESGRPRRGVRLLGASERIGYSVWLQMRLNDDHQAIQASKATARTMLGDREFETAWAEGQAMTPDQAVTYALEGD